MKKFVTIVLLLELLIVMFGFNKAIGASNITFTTVEKAVNNLTVKDEVRNGYERNKFKHWITVSRAGQEGCDSRKSVIIDEAIVKPKISKGCVLTGGEWLSVYDNTKITEAGKLDVDHMVPLAEAWDSGASTWTDLKRQQYANDMTDSRHLIAVTGSSNRSKSDQDPTDWVPTYKPYVCEYLANWVSIKIRWGLSIDKIEKDSILKQLNGCKRTKIVISPLAL
jgi:hypothetical protein